MLLIVTVLRRVDSESVTSVCLPGSGARSDKALVAGWGRASKDRFEDIDNRLRQVV